MRSTVLLLSALCGFAQEADEHAFIESEHSIDNQVYLEKRVCAEKEAPSPSEEAESGEDYDCMDEQVSEENLAAPPPQPSVKTEAPVKTESEPVLRWYFTLNPGYLYFNDASMREFYNTGGFTIRGEAGCRVWGPLIVWMDGGYFEKEGIAIGGNEKHKIMLGTLTLGLKGIYYFHDSVAIYGGAGPRLFIGIIHNESSYIRSVDTAVGVGGGFNGGLWVFPFYKFKNYARNIYLDLFADYSLKTLKVDEDEASSEDFDVNVDSITAGIGIGIRF